MLLTRIRQAKEKLALKTSIMILSIPLCYIITVLPIIIMTLIGLYSQYEFIKSLLNANKIALDFSYYKLGHAINA